jgi:nitronate monooxygenase
MSRASIADTPFTRLVGCDAPIQLAPMAGVCSAAALPLAVAGAGGHAMLPAVMLGAEELAERIDAVAAGTRAFGVNFIGLLLDRECLEVALERAPLVDFHFGRPDPALIETIHAAGALASWQVGSVEQARAAADAGCDLVVAQGREAGGRLAGEVELGRLLDQVLDAVSVPVLAAGGLGSRGEVEAVMAAGAAGVRIGTRFVAAAESDAHPEWKRRLVDAGPGHTVVTTRFSVGVPELPHRVLRSSMDAAAAHPAEFVGEISSNGRRVQVPRFASHPPTREATGAVEAMPFYAGRSVAGVRRIQPAAEVVAELAGTTGDGMGSPVSDRRPTGAERR